MTARSPSHAIESQVASALIAASDGTLVAGWAVPAYLRDHLAEHVRAGNVWESLEGAADLLDALDPGRVAAEAFRSARPVAALPVGVATTSVTAPSLPHTGAWVVPGPGDRGGPVGAPADRAHAQVIWTNLRPVRPHLPLTGHTGWVTGCAFGTRPDGTLLLATTSWDGTVRLWDPATGTPVGDPLTGHTDAVTECAFGTHPDGHPAAGHHQLRPAVWLWDRHRRPCRGTAHRPHPRGDRVRLRHPPGRERWCWPPPAQDRTVRRWDRATGTPVGDPLTGHTDAVTGCAFGSRPDGTLLLATTGSRPDGAAVGPRTGAPLGDPLTGHAGGVSGCAFGTRPDGTLLLATTSSRPDGAAVGPGHRWPGRAPADTGHTRRVTGCAFGTRPDGTLLLATTSDDEDGAAAGTRPPAPRSGTR